MITTGECAHDVLEVLGATMALGDRRIPVSEDGSDRISDDIAATENGYIGASNSDTCGLEEADDGSGGARDEERG